MHDLVHKVDKLQDTGSVTEHNELVILYSSGCCMQPVSHCTYHCIVVYGKGLLEMWS